MAGWIKIYRSLADHWLAEQPEKLGWWTLLLMKVCHEDKKVLIGNHLIELKRGQINISYDKLAQLWKTSKKTAERFVSILEEEKMLTRCVTHKVSVLTICNYESYQGGKRCEVSDTRPDADPILTRSVSTYKEGEEDKEIYNTSTARTYTHTHEQDFINQYRKEGMWADVALILHKPIHECETLFDRWIVEYQHKGDSHQDYSDFKRHFIQWARKAITKEKSNGNDRPDYSRRGRADVPADISLDF